MKTSNSSNDMKIYSNAHPGAMMNAVHEIYGPLAVNLEMRIYALADKQVQGYDGGLWAFHSDGVIGYWVPQGQDDYAVSCPNYYDNPAMDAESLGLALTITAANHACWETHHHAAPALTKMLVDAQEKLRDHAYREAGHLDSCAIAGFLD